MKLRLADFRGRVPMRAGRLLPQNYAQVATNCRTEDGNVVPYRTPSLAHAFGSEVKTIYKDGANWYGWQNDVDVAPGPIAANRLYYTGDGAPKMRVDGEVIALALTPPEAGPEVALHSGTLDEDLEETIIYAYTFVTELEEESAPSPASDPVSYSPGLVFRLSGFSIPDPDRKIDRIRIYRSQTGTSGTTDFYYVAEVALPALYYDHDLELEPIQNAIPSMDYDAPPDDLAHLTALPNGMMVAASGKAILFSEPYLPHAWPRKYELAVDYPIVGFVAFGTTIAILTEATPYIAQGITPDAMTMEKVEADLPCLSKRGIVDMGYSAAYPSPDGLVSISASGAQVITGNLFTRKQWQALNPASFSAGVYGGRYLFAYNAGGGARRLGIIDGDGSAYADSTAHITDMLNDARSANLYVIMETTKAMLWDPPSTDPMTMTWRSKPFHLTSASNFGAILIEGEPEADSDFTARIYADGALIHTITDVEAVNVPKRLPGGFLAEKWEVEVACDFPITAISIAETLSELSEP